jgi:hypothetical protein
MIQIFEPNGKIIKEICNDNFFNLISGRELLEDHPEIDATHWRFVVFPPEIVTELYARLKKEWLADSLEEAYEQHLGVIEICKGDYEKPTWIPLTGNIDIGKLKKDWYFECCKKHGFFVIEE